MLRQGLGQHKDISDSIEAMMMSGGLNYPVIICDGTIALWMEIQDWLLNNHLVGMADRCSQERVSWALGKWTPSTSTPAPVELY